MQTFSHSTGFNFNIDDYVANMDVTNKIPMVYVYYDHDLMEP